jgi:hypothetical protein
MAHAFPLLLSTYGTWYLLLLFSGTVDRAAIDRGARGRWALRKQHPGAPGLGGWVKQDERTNSRQKRKERNS